MAKTLKIIEIPCFNCGKLVLVQTPFFGCVFCEKCNEPKSWSLDGKDTYFTGEG